MRFLLLTEGLEAQPAGTDEQTRAYNQRWIEWAGWLIQSGTLVAGGPLGGRTFVRQCVDLPGPA